MRLDLLLGGVDVLEERGDTAVDVTAVTHDSRVVGAGAMFCCVTGQHHDGHDLAPAAVDAGAVALLCERIVPVGVTQVRVRSVRPAMAQVAATFWGQPSSSLAVCGVTGTNGKTTTTYLLQSILEVHGWPTSLFGTLSGVRTTPESTVLQEQLAQARDSGHRAVAMEVSSHALDQHRVDAVEFAVAGFTSLSQDHLEYHGDMEGYFAAKARLFEPGRSRQGVVNADDAYGRRLLDAAAIPMRPYSRTMAEDLLLGAAGARFGWQGQPVELRLGGGFNVDNALCAATMADCLGVSPEAVARGLSRVSGVPGRYELVDAGQDFAVIVDYAHTPDGLQQVLSAVRGTLGGDGRVIAVFGCGGERDPSKRPVMGRVASELADIVIVTSDNPRGEDPDAIIDEIVAGASGPVSVVTDRADAIRAAVTAARRGDAVVLAGKGHETGQDLGDRTVPFDDRQAARAALMERR